MRTRDPGARWWFGTDMLGRDVYSRVLYGTRVSLMVGFGVAWASMMGVPYIMVVGSIPKERYGVYMGIINMMIVVPMILQTLSFGYVYKHLLGDDPANAISFAGVLLLLAALATTRIKKDVVSDTDEVAIPVGGGH
jgi:maltose/moltooligosaccharide transporter